MNRLSRLDPRIIVGAGILALLLIGALGASAFAPHPPERIHDDFIMAPPGTPGFLLGTDTLGRDLLSRMLYGARVSLLVGASVVVIAGIFGVTVGLVAGAMGGWVDHVAMRITEIILSFPPLLLAVAIVGVRGPGVPNLIIALVVFSWTDYARVVRGEMLALREEPYVEAGRSIGMTEAQLVLRYMLPGVANSIVILGTFGMASAILAEAALSFLGLGVVAPAASWGSILSDARVFLRLAPHLVVFPGLALMVTVMALHLLGDGLRDWLDPRSK